MAENQVFDRDMLRQSVDGDEELAEQVIGIFLTEVPAQLAEIDAALAAGDAATVECVAHSIKGASDVIGGRELRETAFACEQFGRDGRLDDVRAGMADMRARYAALEKELRANGFGEA